MTSPLTLLSEPSLSPGNSSNERVLRLEQHGEELMIEYKRHIDQLHEGFLVTNLVTLNHSQVTRTTPELAPPIS
ncbi:hypothetical protein TNCV_2265191 [Trichonephila clavipes]|nr:hypothetical protein TNCV_2265191 [Trichonephila clavipes]